MMYQQFVKSKIQTLPKYRDYLKPIYDHKYYELLSKIYAQGDKIRIATDCSGLDTPVYAMKSLSLPLDHIWSCDRDPHTQTSVACNYNPKYMWDDIFERDYSKLPKIDWYVAGFPCQTFSSLGGRDGFFDQENRGVVFFACLNTIKATQPTVAILENVKGLLTHDHGQTFETILKMLKELGNYEVHWQVLNTMDYNVPQSRPRIYIVCLRKDKIRRKFKFPKPIKLTTGVMDLIEDPVTSIGVNELRKLTAHKRDVLEELSETRDLREPWVVNLNVSSGKRSNARLNASACLFATSGRFYLTNLGRSLSPREYLRLQGFGDDYKICVTPAQMYHQAGNGMSVNVLCYLIRNILEAVY